MKRTTLVALALLVLSATPSVSGAQLGQDKNANNLWDDVETYLQQNFSKSREKMAAYTQLAIATQMFMVSGLDPAYTSDATQALRQGLECAFYVGRFDSEKEIMAIQSFMRRDPQRNAAFTSAEQNAKGKPLDMIQDPRQWHQSCKTPVRILANWPQE